MQVVLCSNHAVVRASGAQPAGAKKNARAPAKSSGLSQRGHSNNRDGDGVALLGRREALAAVPLGSVLASVLASDGIASIVFPEPAGAAVLTPEDGPVLVVGATGATGRRVVGQLRSKGVAVRAGARDVKKAKGLGLAASGAELVQMDVLDETSIAAAMIGASAVICATGFTPSFNLGKDNPAKVDHIGTDNLVRAAQIAGVKKFVLVTSLLTNAKAAGQKDNDNYKFLNALGGVLDEKLAAELNLRASGLDYTIVRPGGLSNEPPENVGNLIVRGEDTTFGLESDPGREISRDTVAAVCVEALFASKAENKVVEIVSSPSAPVVSTDMWFA